MKKHRRADADHLQDAVEHLHILDNHLRRGGLNDVLIRDAVSHRLEMAIDAISRVSPELLDSEAPDDWPKIVVMRNMLAHQYADLDPDILQNTIDNRLGDLRELLTRLDTAIHRSS